MVYIVLVHISHLPPEGCENKMDFERWLYFTNMKDFVCPSLQMLFENSSSDYDPRGSFSFAKQINLLFLLEQTTHLNISTFNYMIY